MPIRLFIYLAEVYKKIIDNKIMYYKKVQKIPKPEFFVLYNGEEDFPENEVLRLSDAFSETDNTHTSPKCRIEFDVPVININKGHNEKLVVKSENLSGYVELVTEIRKNAGSGMELKEAISKAIKDCIDKKIISDFLENNSSEVINMLNAEYDINDEISVVREEVREEVRTEDKLSFAKKSLENGIDLAIIAKITSLPISQIKSIATHINKAPYGG
jgi:hypothetical protein